MKFVFLLMSQQSDNSTPFYSGYICWSIDSLILHKRVCAINFTVTVSDLFL